MGDSALSGDFAQHLRKGAVARATALTQDVLRRSGVSAAGPLPLQLKTSWTGFSRVRAKLELENDAGPASCRTLNT